MAELGRTWKVLAVGLLLSAQPLMADTADERDDQYYDQLRDQIYEADWSDNLCGRVEAFHIYIGGLYEKLALIDAHIAHKEQQLAQATNPAVQRSLERQLEKLSVDREGMLTLVRVTYQDTAEASIAPGETACDTPNLYFVGDAVAPFVDDLPGSYGPDPRPLAALADANGNTGYFFSTELVVEQTAAAEIAANWNGTVMKELPSAFPGAPSLTLIVVDTSGADPAAFPGLQAQLTDTRGAVIEVSSPEGLALLTVAAAEAAAGHLVGINWLGRPTGYEDGTLEEDAEGPGGWTDLPAGRWSDNPYDWNHLRQGSDLMLGVVEAWTLLDEAGKLDNKIGIGILDGGFYRDVNGDFPVGFRSFSVVGGTAPVNTSGLDPGKTDHGTPVLNTAAAAANNGAGVIGTGSPVADTIAIFSGYDLFHTISALDQGRIAGVRVANMSYGGWIPAGLEWSMLPFELSFLGLHNGGLVLVASAGNSGDNNDDQVCLGDLCWETGVKWPCELNNTYCIGGLQTRPCNDPMEVGRCGGEPFLAPRRRAPNSNFGAVPNDDTDIGHPGDATVDIFAPYRVIVGPRPAVPGGVHEVNGTSFSAPYVAGVAALVWAADPSMSPSDVTDLLHYRGEIPRDAEGVRDPEVKVIIDPLDSVASALDEACPCISIKRPVDGESYPEGDGILPRATFYGGTVVNAEWTVFFDSTAGPVEATRTSMTATEPVRVVGGGQHVYQLAVSFDNGDVVTEHVTVDYINSAPIVDLLSPLTSATLTNNEPVRLRAFTSDAGYAGQLPDSSVSWYLDDSTTPFATGHDTTVTFAGETLGFHNLRVVADDGFATASDFIGFTLIEGGDNSPPNIVISSPTDGDVIYGTVDEPEYVAEVDFQAVASDPDATDVLQVDWFVSQDGGSLQYIGAGSQILGVPLRIQSCFGSTFTITAIVSDGLSERSDTVAIAVRGTEIC